MPGRPQQVGTVVAITRYPVKSMAGERMPAAQLNAAGLVHDRLFALECACAARGMLRLTGPLRREMLRYTAHVTDDERVEVLCPTRERFEIHAPELLQRFAAADARAGEVSLTHSRTPQTDVRPLSLISIATLEALSAEAAREGTLDARRLRSNFVCELEGGAFAEDGLCGRSIRLGAHALLAVRERIPRCRFITYDPADPAQEPMFSLMRLLERQHGGRAGVYASVAAAGTVAVGDAVWLAEQTT